MADSYYYKEIKLLPPTRSMKYEAILYYINEVGVQRKIGSTYFFTKFFARRWLDRKIRQCRKRDDQVDDRVVERERIDDV